MNEQSVNCKLATFVDVEQLGIIAAARRDGVTIRSDDTIFVVDAVAVGCVRMIGSSRARLCGCWVAPEYRGRGIGENLVRQRLEYVERETLASVVDTFAFNRRLFVDLGFAEIRSYKIGTTLLEKSVTMGGLVIGTTDTELLGRTTVAEVWIGSFYGVTSSAMMLAVDPPWRQGHLTYWSNKAGVSQEWDTFVSSMMMLIRDSKFQLIYIKCGVLESTMWMRAMQEIGPHVNALSWTTKYYAGQNAQVLVSETLPIEMCPQLSDSKAATATIAKWASAQGIESAVDPCVGLGKMLRKFQTSGMRVAGIELNKDRADVAAKRLGIRNR